MPRKYLIRSNHLPYHVVCRGNNRDTLPCAPEYAWKTVSRNLGEMTEISVVQIHALVMMPNHIHLLLTTPHQDLGLAMQRFVACSTKTINRISGRSGRIFGGRYHWSLISNAEYFDIALKYVYRNPVKAGICNQVEHYSFSTINASLGLEKAPFPIEPINGSLVETSQFNIQERLDWLNQPFKKEFDQAIQKGFQQTSFPDLKSIIR